MLKIEVVLKDVVLSIGDINIRLICYGDNWRCFFSGDVERFCKEGSPHITLKAYYGKLPRFSEKDLVFDSGGNWALFRRKSSWMFFLKSPVTGKLPYAVAIINRNFSRGKIYLRPLKEHIYGEDSLPLVDPLEYPLDEILMVHLLSFNRGVLLHACGIEYNDGGVIFVGISGSGKSTIANLYKKIKEVNILSDDRIIVRRQDTSFYIYGTPWHGDSGVCSQRKTPLKAIFFLKHSPQNFCRRLLSVNAASRLFVCSFPTFWDKRGLEYTLNVCSHLAENIPCYELGFVPDDSILEFLNNRLCSFLKQNL